MAVFLLVVGAAAAAFGWYQWRLDPPAEHRLPASRPVALPQTHRLLTGVTLFAAVPDHRNPPAAAAFGCRVTEAGRGRQVALDPRRDSAGSRVREGIPLSPVVEIGATQAGQSLRCDGPAAVAAPALWLLPTSSSPSVLPLALVTGGLLLVGLGLLVHPRTRPA